MGGDPSAIHKPGSAVFGGIFCNALLDQLVDFALQLCNRWTLWLCLGLCLQLEEACFAFLQLCLENQFLFLGSGNHGLCPNEALLGPFEETLVCLDSLVHRENLGLRACTGEGCLQQGAQWIAFSQRSDSSLQSFHLQICLGSGCFWEATGAALQKPAVSLPLSRAFKRAMSGSTSARGGCCGQRSGCVLRPLGGLGPIFVHFAAGGRVPRITCNHPSGTGTEVHPLRGITQRLIGEQKRKNAVRCARKQHNV